METLRKSFFRKTKGVFVHFCWLIAILFMSGVVIGVECGAANNDWKIECAYYNAPDLTAYLYGAKHWNGINKTASASLQTMQGEVRELEYKKKSGKRLLPDKEGQGTIYYYLIDVTASMDTANITATRKHILKHIGELKGEDQICVYTFGGRAKQIGGTLKGSDGRKSKNKLKKDIKIELKKGKGDGRGSTVYKAMEQIMDEAAGETSRENKDTDIPPRRKICLLITDGMDRNFGAADQVTFEQKIQQSHVAFYGFGVNQKPTKNSQENSAAQQENKEQLKQYCATSGGDWTFEPENKKVRKRLNQKVNALSNCYMIQFTADNNKISQTNETLTITTSNRSSERTILVNSFQKDDTAPRAKSIKKTGNDSISFKFTEKVVGADVKENYSVKNKDEDNVDIKVISYDEEKKECEVIFKEVLYSGEYTLIFKNITDDTMEKNVVKKAEFEIEGKSVWVGTVEYIIKNFWWVLALIVIIIAVFVVYKKLNDQGGIVIVDGKVSIKNKIGTIAEPKVEIQTKGKQLYMEMQEPNGKISEICIQLDGSIFVGRAPFCNIVVDDPMISRQHFVIEEEGGYAYINDLGTKNGTYVNNVQITGRHMLQPNDRITVGKQTFIFHKIQ